GMIPAFARMNAVRSVGVPLVPDLRLDVHTLLDTRAAVTYVCRPNNPPGTQLDRDALLALERDAAGAVLVGEAYLDFAGEAGLAVRLADGAVGRATVCGDDPAAQALACAEAGAQHLHVVDLGGAFAGESGNREAVERIVEAFPGYVQLGGGIRTPEAVEGWF